MKKRFVCLLCKNQFQTALLLERHKRDHKKIKKHECRICNWTASTNFGLELHMTKYHNSDLNHKYKYKCLLCNFSAKSAFLKDRHMDNVHKTPEPRPTLIDAYEIFKSVAMIGLIFH